ncbi:hypothetical protein BYT27DRAFT_7237189 [Phlegmacium glaucopus]|nr:hypothetical protein BYT27DRAFT_7237189 [Phlegmacium glaucopus]
MPHTKRQKMQGEHSAYARDRLFASRTASLRRADSLKSVQAFGDGKTPTQAGCVPTVPATPVLAPRKSRRKAVASPRPLRHPVPIIAPPLDYVPKLPLSAETLAKIRLGKFLEREGRGREKDGLPVSGWERPPSGVVGSDDDGSDDDEEEFGAREDEMIEWELALGIGQRAREEVIDWILDVTPAPPPKKKYIAELSPTLSASGTFSLSRSSSSTTSSTSMDSQPSDLMDQLENSPETRFHAAWLFLRYCYITMGPKNNARNLSRQSSFNSNISANTDQEGRNLIIWDIAVACLALSVKFHRDFLEPLLPVYVHEYLSLAPQNLSYEDLETSQRDLLSAFDYSLGVTPQPVIDELWFSLESLRTLLDFKNGWETAMADAWCGLFDAICEPDVQRFSISTLAAVALMDGVIESLVQRYLYEAALKIKAAAASIFNCPSSTSSITRENRRRRRVSSGDSLDWGRELELAASRQMEMGKSLKGLNRNRKKYLRKAERASEGVRYDIQALVGITDAQLRNCRDWFSGLHCASRSF